ncbi:MAG: hypothetical protein IPI26_09005 [Elusimicrobia bacterium]|nr:hypothetical protein [Elusimicrobiota bacterium]
MSPDPSLGAFFLISLVRMFMLRKLMGQSAKPLASCATDLMDLFLNGLGRKRPRPVKNSLLVRSRFSPLFPAWGAEPSTGTFDVVTG